VCVITPDGIDITIEVFVTVKTRRTCALRGMRKCILLITNDTDISGKSKVGSLRREIRKSGSVIHAAREIRICVHHRIDVAPKRGSLGIYFNKIVKLILNDIALGARRLQDERSV